METMYFNLVKYLISKHFPCDTRGLKPVIHQTLVFVLGGGSNSMDFAIFPGLLFN